MKGNRNKRDRAREKKGRRYLLFSLDGVGWSHVIAGDVTALSGRQGARQPPVPFSAEIKPGHRASQMLITHPLIKWCL